MIRQVANTIASNSSNHFHRPESPCVGRSRTLKIRFRKMDNGPGFEVHAWGGRLDETRISPYIGHLYAEAPQIRTWINEFFRTWQKEVIDWNDPDDHRPWAMHRKPFANHVDLRTVAAPPQLEAMWRKIAVAGRQLFGLLFSEGDDQLRLLRDALIQVLWKGEHVITVLSDDLIAPWSMLYVPRPGTPSELDSHLTVVPEAFLGYRHLIEHAFEMGHYPDPGIRFAQLSAAAYFDQGLDEPVSHHRSRDAIVAPVLALLDKHAAVRRGTSPEQVEEYLRAEGAHDHLIYFCCHCVEVSPESSQLILTNGDAISSGNIASWLGDYGLHAGPFVMINACQAGDFGSHSPSHFGRVLLNKGASSLLGPSVNIPAIFAGEFAEHLLSIVLASGQTFGEAVRSLARHYADSHRNPLGLSYSLYHGIDGHFCFRENARALAPAES